MDTQFVEKFGVEIVDDECIEVCKGNPIIIPQFVRYLGMGWYQILACSYNPNRFFLIDMGGSNGYDYEYNLKLLNKLTLKDSVSFDELNTRLEKESRCKIQSSEFHEYGRIDVVKEYRLDDD